MHGLSSQDAIRLIALTLVVMVLSLTVHECAHAWVARKLGDDTAERQGRLSLSPVTHIDVLGTLIIPVLGALTGGFAFIGWARPTPVNPARFRRGVNMRSGMALVAAAGPASNIVLASISAAAYSLLEHQHSAVLWSGEHRSGVGALLIALFQINVGLATFNLLPIPPLDGSRLLPRSFDELQARLAPFSFIVLLVVLNVGPLRHVLLEIPRDLLSDAIATVFRLPA